MDLTPKQQASEAIRQANNILIMSGQHPSLDQVAAMSALASILRKYGKKVSAVVSDAIPPQLAFLEPNLERNLSGLRDFIVKVDVRKAELDKLRYEVENDKLNIYITPFRGAFAPNDVTFDHGDYQYDIAIVLGVPTRARLDRIYDQHQKLFTELPLINIDFHRSNENYGAVNLIEGNASSLCEIIVALAESLQSGIIDEDIATALLAGLMASTDRFTATHTSPKSLTVAAQLMAAGARQQSVVKALYRDNRDRGERTEKTERPEKAERQERPELSERREIERPLIERVANTDPREIRAEHQAVSVAELEEPILEPQHIELTREFDGGAPISDAMVADAPRMADFSAAAEILNQMARDHRSENSGEQA